jgi:3-oxoacyl-[acyl-carrier protein] reductase
MIGTAIAARFALSGLEVLGISRTVRSAPVAPPKKDSVKDSVRLLAFDPLSEAADWDALGAAPFDCVVWAQGANCNDSLYAFEIAAHRAMLEANVVYVSASLAALLRRGQLARPARLCVISSIWQTVARQDKFSYTVSKAALQGLVQAAAIDLGRDGHLINAVLPGVLDTPMTRAMLTPEQIDRVERMTPFGRLATPQDVAEMAEFLCSDRNRSITGQFVAVDLGFQHAKQL